jgi:hypothetical protein
MPYMHDQFTLAMRNDGDDSIARNQELKRSKGLDDNPSWLHDRWIASSLAAIRIRPVSGLKEKTTRKHRTTA